MSAQNTAGARGAADRCPRGAGRGAGRARQRRQIDAVQSHRAAGARSSVRFAGTTRDLNVGQAEHRGRNFFVVDSGGLELGGRERLASASPRRRWRAVALADVVVFMLDGRAGLGPGDREAIALIRETGRPMVAAINKMDRPGRKRWRASIMRWASPMVLVSAAHGRGVEELLDESSSACPKREGRGRRRISGSRSSAVPTSANRRCSIASPASSARSSTTLPAPRATRSTCACAPPTATCS